MVCCFCDRAFHYLFIAGHYIHIRHLQLNVFQNILLIAIKKDLKDLSMTSLVQGGCGLYLQMCVTNGKFEEEWK